MALSILGGKAFYRGVPLSVKRSAFQIPGLRCQSTLSHDHIVPTDVFRDTMSTIGSQAMILTAPFEGAPTTNKFHGMTLSSVCSLAVNPEPLLQFNLQVPSSTSESLHRLNHFAFHIMPPNDNSVRLARIFSQGIRAHKDANGNIIHTRPFMSLAEDEWELYDSPNAPPLSMDPDHTNRFLKMGVNIPILSSAERVFICEKRTTFRVSNHEIWVCAVKDIKVNVEYGDEAKTGGLLYFNRKFHKIGTSLQEPKKK